jgi:hypothetical protein
LIEKTKNDDENKTPKSNIQEYINQKYPDKNTEEIEEILGEIEGEQINLSTDYSVLEGELNLSDYPKLKKCTIKYTKMTAINIEGCVNLEELRLRRNELKSIKFGKSVNSLKILTLGDNNFPEQDLSLFKDLKKVEWLEVHNYNRYEHDPIYNKFHGSLKPLKGLENLGKLWVTNTNIDSGLEYLPESCHTILCGDQ